MEWTVEFRPDKGIILTTVSGASTLEDVVHIASDSLEEARKAATDKILCDYRNASSRLSTLEIHNLPGLFIKAGLKHSDRVALVYAGSRENSANLSFFDTRCSNTSLMIRVFTDYDEALHWLTV